MKLIWLGPMRTILPIIFLFTFLSACNQEQEGSDELEKESFDSSFTTQLGKTYQLAEPSEKLISQYEEAKANFEANPEDVESLIWYGRRTAYLGQYNQAIDIFSQGIESFPKEPKLYRHRGHRYISIREFDKAIADLEKASELIQGTSNEIEPDGMPNALNIPVSSLHGNIYYHLGLAYYLIGEYEKAYDAYLKCRESGSHYDNIVSSTHWLYMIQQRMGNPAKADSLLAPIHADSTVIENQSYADLCKLYKGWVPVDSLIQQGPGGNPSNDAVRYGVANWYLYNGDTSRAKNMIEGLLETNSFASFGYIAAEQDWIRMFNQN
ncbi:tetratricopeptide repeat protein [uncultured Algoriphagus sp.]|uniref:tetratricopeptide repeat protein n=1 Tax=uncultured Algoriphagus sp. TaxID=417365 RepID=UPI00258A5FF0|nr:tetratricopeptide repeat protein [uncultured Algoriphagus sp.]